MAAAAALPPRRDIVVADAGGPMAPLATALRARLLAERRPINPLSALMSLRAAARLQWPLGDALVQRLLSDLTPAQLAALRPADHASLLWALSRLGAPTEGAAWQAALAGVSAAADSLAPHVASSALWALGRAAAAGRLPLLTRGRDKAARAPVATRVAAARLLGRIVEAGDGADPQTVANAAWAAATLKLYLPAAYAALAHQTRRRLGEMQNQGLANVLWATATADHHDGPLLDAVASELGARAASLSPQDVANCLWALAALDHAPADGAALPALLGRAAEVAGRFTPQGVANVLWAAAVLHAPPGPAIDALFDRAAALGDAMGVRGRLQLHQALGDFERRGGGGGGGRLPPALRRACADAARSSTAEWSIPSESQNAVVAAARRMGLSLLVEAPIGDGSQAVDLLLALPDGRRVALEVDGPTHFTATLPRRRLGRNVLRDRQLAAAGLEPVSLPLTEWPRSPREQDAFLWRLLRLDGYGQQGGGG